MERDGKPRGPVAAGDAGHAECSADRFIEETHGAGDLVVGGDGDELPAGAVRR